MPCFGSGINARVAVSGIGDAARCRDNLVRAVTELGEVSATWQTTLARVARTGTATIALAVVLGLLGEQAWVFDLFSQFQVYYAVAALVLAFVALAARARVSGLVALTLAIVCFARIAPFYVAREPAVTPNAPQLRLLHFNVRLENVAHEQEIARYLDHSGADLVLTVETDAAWLAFLRGALSHYELVVANGEGTLLNHYFGIALFVRRGVAPNVTVQSHAELFMEHRHGHPALAADLLFAGRPLALLGVHQHPPISGVHASIRDEQYVGTARWVDAQHVPRVVLGDMNASPWSAPYRALVANTGLLNAQLGRGLHSTWFPLGDDLLGLPLDHCLYSRELVVRSFALGPSLGSDHRPVLVNLSWASAVSAAR